MSSFTSMSVGVNALMAAQLGLNSTSNNITNAETEGYVRQITILSDYNYKNIGNINNLKQIGRGAFVSETSRVRDILLDKAFREQSGREGFYSSLYTATSEVETILGELEGVTFQENLKNLWSAMQELSEDPESTVAKTEMIMSAESFLTTAKAVYSEFAEYQQTLNIEIQNQVEEINKLADQIDDLNKKIAAIEGPKVEDANNYRDQRDLALDKLSKLLKISYEEYPNGAVSVIAEGVPFITEGTVFHMEVEALDGENDSPYLTPVWPHTAEEDGGKGRVFNLNKEISTAKSNDIGSLKGLVLARGSYPTHYTNVPKASDYPGGESDPDYIEAVKKYNIEVDASVVMKSEALFDKLINGIVETINDIVSPTITKSFDMSALITLNAGSNLGQANVRFAAPSASPATTITVDGTTYTVKNMLSSQEGAGAPTNPNEVFFYTDTREYVFAPSVGTGNKNVTFNYENVRVLDSENCSVGSDGKLPAQELFTRKETDRYIEVESSDGNKYYVFNEYNLTGRTSLYTTDNVEVNAILLDDCSKFPSTTQNGYADMELGRKLVEAWDADFAAIDPNYVTVKNFHDFYNEMIYQIANDGSRYLSMLTSQETTVSSLTAAKDELTGVSTDEELTYLIKFQSAYNASSRYINVIDEMLEHIIMRL